MKNTKFCSKCQQIKSVDLFVKDRCHLDGLSTYCSACRTMKKPGPKVDNRYENKNDYVMYLKIETPEQRAERQLNFIKSKIRK